MTDNDTQKMYMLIAKYKPDNYTKCSSEDTIFINNYIDKKIQQKDFSILTDMQKNEPELYPVNQDFDLHEHYKAMYQEFNQDSFPTYDDKKTGYTYNIKNVYNRNKNIENLPELDKLNSIFKKISNPDNGVLNRTLKNFSDNHNIVFKIIEGDSFDGECRFQNHNSHDTKKSFIISITQGALKANDDALAVLLAHELSHGMDISKIPDNYIGSIGWEAQEDFANIIGAKIAKNAGYNPAEFLYAQGKNNEKTQRAADMINQYVIDLPSTKNKLAELKKKIKPIQSINTVKSDTLQELRGITNLAKPPFLSQQISNTDMKTMKYIRESQIKQK